MALLRKRTTGALSLRAALRREATPAADVIGRVVTGKPGTIAVV